MDMTSLHSGKLINSPLLVAYHSFKKWKHLYILHRSTTLLTQVAGDHMPSSLRALTILLPLSVILSLPNQTHVISVDNGSGLKTKDLHFNLLVYTVFS